MSCLHFGLFVLLAWSGAIEALLSLRASTEQVANFGATGHAILLEALYLPASLLALIHLLRSPRYDWATIFKRQRSFSCPVEAARFVSLAMAHTSLHELLLPMAMVTREPVLSHALLPHIVRYRPRLIVFPAEGSVASWGTAEHYALLAPLLDHPERLGTMGTAHAAVRHLGLPAWELTPCHPDYGHLYAQLGNQGVRGAAEGQRGAGRAHHQVRAHLCDDQVALKERMLLVPLAAALAAVYRRGQQQQDALLFLARLRHQTPLIKAIRRLAQGGCSQSIYQLIKVALLNLRLSPSRLALWKGKLVLGLLCAAARALLSVPRKFLRRVLSRFITEHPGAIAPAYWLAIAKQAALLKVHLPLAKMGKKRQKRLRRLLASPDLIQRDLILVAPEDLSLRCELWRKRVFFAAERIRWPDQGIGGILDLVRFVDANLISLNDADSLLRSLPLGDTLSVHIGGRHCQTTICLLQRATHLFRAQVLRRVAITLPPAPGQTPLWKTLCWLVCANLLHRRTLGLFPALSTNILAALFDREGRLGADLHALIQSTLLTRYIPRGQLLTPLAIFRYHWQYPKPEEAALFLCFGYLILLSVLCTITA